MTLKGVGNKSRQSIMESFDTSAAYGSVKNMGNALQGSLEGVTSWANQVGSQLGGK